MASIMENITESTMETMEKNDNNNQKRLQKKWLVLLIVCLVVAAVSGGVLIKNHLSAKQVEEELEKLAQQTAGNTTAMDGQTDGQEKNNPGQNGQNQAGQNLATPSATLEPTAEELYAASVEELEQMGIPVPDKTIDFTDLQENTSADIYAWIYIPDTKIDYPVLQHPTDNSYYLNYNLDGSKGYPGCIYTEDYNAKDFSDVNTVIYGHNMKNGTMFAGLHQYGDSEFFAEHPYIYIYTPEKLFAYEVFASYEAGNEHILLSYAFDNKTIFQNYLDDIFNMRTMNCIHHIV